MKFSTSAEDNHQSIGSVNSIIAITRFEHRTITTGCPEALTESELRHFVTDAPASVQPKSDLPLWSPAQFRNNQRKLENVEAVTLLVFDFDRPEAEPEQFFARVATALPCAAWLAHSSYSSTQGAWRFRLILPLDRQATAAEAEYLWNLVARVVRDAGLQPDAQCKDASRAYYVPVRPPSGAYASKVREGDPLPVATIALLERGRELEMHARQQSGPPMPCAGADAVRVMDRARRYLERIPPAVSGRGGHRQTFLAASALVRDFGLADAEAYLLLSEWNRHCEPPWSERDLRRKLREARERGRRPLGRLRAANRRGS